MTTCPRCQSAAVRRSRSRTQWESWRKAVTGKRPYRCDGCGWRGWSVDPGRTSAPRSEAPAPEPPNLRGTALGPGEWSRSLDLRALDAPQPADES